MFNILLFYFMLQLVLIFFVILSLDNSLYYMLIKPYIKLTGITSYSYANLYDLFFFNYKFCIYYFLITAVPIYIYIFKIIYSNSFSYKYITIFKLIYLGLFNCIYICIFFFSFFFILYVYLILLYKNQIFDSTSKYFLAYELFFTKYMDFWFICALFFNCAFLSCIDNFLLLSIDKSQNLFYYDFIFEFFISFCFTTIVVPPFIDMQLLFCFYFYCCYLFIYCLFENYNHYYFDFLK